MIRVLVVYSGAFKSEQVFGVIAGESKLRIVEVRVGRFQDYIGTLQRN